MPVVRNAVRTIHSLTRLWYLWAVVGVSGRWVWCSQHSVGHGKGSNRVSVAVARADSIALVPTFGLDAFGPIPDVIDRARSGDRVAFAELYDTHVDSVYRYLLYRVREPSDAEDLCSEVFTRAFANIHRYRWQGKSFLAWLYTIARNAVTDRRRRERPTVDLDNAYGVAEDGPTAHDRAVRGEQVDARS